MDDLISRHAALQVLRDCKMHCIDYLNSYHIDIEDAEYRIKTLPSAQPNREWDGNTISREAIINKIEEYANDLGMLDWHENPDAIHKIHTLNWVLNAIRDLPAVQAERKPGVGNEV